MLKSRIFLSACALLLALGVFTAVRAQEPDEGETVRVRTRVVTLDALVKDKRTNAPVTDLTKENFEVLSDGRARELTYFSREGDAGRRPLALTLVLDLRRDGAGRFLRRADVLEALGRALSKLPAADEVAVLALDVRGTGDRRWLTRFTRDRALLASALATLPTLVAEKKETQTSANEGTQTSANTSVNQETQTSAGDAPPNGQQGKPTPPQDFDENNLDPKEGIGEIRTRNKDGSVTVKYVNKDGAMVRKTLKPDGSEEVDIDYGFELSAAVHEAALISLQERPNSQAALVWVSDGIAPIPYEDRDQTERSLVQTNVIYNAVVADMKSSYKLFMPIVKPIGNWVGLSIYGSAQYLAKRTGGEALRVHRASDYATALEKIVGSLAARYSLGFTIAENEQDDGQMHALEVRVRARDAKGKERKLQITARQGYFMPQTTAAPQPSKN